MSVVSEFPRLAEGARRLHVRVHEGDLELRVVEGAAWSLDWDAEERIPPQLVRDGDELLVKPTEDGWHHGRTDVRVTAPAGLESVELHTGSGDVEATGVRGHCKLHSGSGDVQLRDGAGEADVRSGQGDVEVERYDGRLRLSSGQGDVRCADAHGELAVQTGQGDVDVERVHGELEVRTGSGDVDVRLTGPTGAKVDTGSGDVEVTGGALRGLLVRTGAGDVTCRADVLPGKYEFTTGAGDAEIELPVDARVRINVQTAMGDIHSDFPLVRVGRSGPMGFGGGRMVGSTGDGEPEIELSMRTGTGDISIRRAGGPRGVRVGPSVVEAGGWEARIDDEAGELTLKRPGDPEPMVSVPMPRGIGSFVRRTVQEALGGLRHETRGAERVAERAAREAERAVERAAREATKAFGEVIPSPPPPPTPPPPASPAPPGPPAAPDQPRREPEDAGDRPMNPVPPQDDPTLKVLEALAKGEISVDEAQALLNKR